MRLYRVRVEFEYGVLADDEYEARAYVADAVESANITVIDAETVGHAPPEGWGEDTLVYNRLGRDVTWAQAIEEDKGS